MPALIEPQRLYLLDTALSHSAPFPGRILSCNPDGSDLRPVLTNLPNMPDGVTLDTSAGHLYWTNMGPNFNTASGSISRCDLDGSNVVTIIPGGVTYTPKQLTFASTSRKLYWCDREGMRVMRCDLDGNHVEILLSTRNEEGKEEMEKWCVGIAVDETRGHIYWSQKGPSKGKKGRIFRAPIPASNATIEENGIEVLFNDLPEPIDLDIDTATQTLYWTDRGDPPQGNSLNRANVESQLKTYTKEILARRLHEAIGLTLDVERGRAFVADLAGGVYMIDIAGRRKGTDIGEKTVLFSELGDLTGVALG